MLKTNIVSNLAANVWIAVLTLVITPLQVRFLGMEAYAIVALIASLQVVLSSLDLGLSATTTKAISADTTDGFAATASLTNSTATVYWGFAVAIAVALSCNASTIARHWLKPSTLSPSTVVLSVRIIAAYLALRWPIAFYTGVITGLQRLDILNLIKSTTSTVRLVGGSLLLPIVPSLTVFLSWFAVTAFAELVTYVVVAHRLMPHLRLRPGISLTALASMWRFSGSMTIIALISVLLTQVDRLVVSHLLDLESLGYYSLAYSTAIGISLLQVGVNTASLPAFSRSKSAGAEHELRLRYHKTTQLIAYGVAAPCFILVFFGGDILGVWVGVGPMQGATIPLRILAAGFFLNAVVSPAYTVAVAVGQPTMPLVVNLVVIVPYGAALYYLTKHFGVSGTAATWLALNLYYLIVLFPLSHKRLLRLPLLPWVGDTLAPSILLSLFLFGGARLAANLAHASPAIWVALAASLLLYAAAAIRLVTPALRADILSIPQSLGARLSAKFG